MPPRSRSANRSPRLQVGRASTLGLIGSRRSVLACLAGLLILGAPLASVSVMLRDRSANAGQLGADRHSIAELETRIRSLEARMGAQVDWTTVARNIQSSIFTIETRNGLGSAWVARTSPGGSDLITNFHVVAEAWNAGEVTVHVRQGDQTIDGTITRAERSQDLAVIHIAQRFPALPTAPGRPQLGDTGMAGSSPIGLGSSVSLGGIGRLRSLNVSDYIQVSATNHTANQVPTITGHKPRYQ